MGAVLDEIGISFADAVRMLAAATVEVGTIPFYPGVRGVRAPRPRG